MTTRHPDTPNNEQPHSRRWVTPSNYHTNSYIDKVDELKMLIDPKSAYLQNQGSALGRKTDDIIIAAALGPAAAGNTPTTSTVAFKDETVSINGDGTVTTVGTLAAVTTVADMGLAKMLTMKQLFDESDVDEDIMLYWAISPKDAKNMLDVTEVGSSDYNSTKTLVAGSFVYFGGFNWFKTNKLTSDAAAGTGRRTIAWAQDGIIYGSAQGVVSHIDELPTKSYSTQVYSRMNGGAVRMDGDKVHECLNKIA